FFDEIVDGAHLLPTQAEEALAELVALGVVNSDSFGGLRALLIPSDRRRPAMGGRRKRRIALFGMDAAGRWALVRRNTRADGEGQTQPMQNLSGVAAHGVAGGAAARNGASGGVGATASAGSITPAQASARLNDEETTEHIARTLLRRWGVVFWRLLAREADW